MSIGPFASPLHLSDDYFLCGIINPIDDPVIADTNAIERFKQFLASMRARDIFEGVKGLRNGGVISGWDFIQLFGDALREFDLIHVSLFCGRRIYQRRHAFPIDIP